MLRGFRGEPDREELGRRTGLRPSDIADVREHRDGRVVTTVDGGELLVSGTVVRRYVPEVDDAEPVRVTEPDTSAADAKPAPRPRAPGRRCIRRHAPCS